MSIFDKSENIFPYEISAHFYDILMEHVDYHEWADYIHLLLKKYHFDGNRIVDCGCGTGTFLSFMNELGYHGAGFDLSYPMIRKAAEKLGLVVWQGDLKNFYLKPFSGVCVCLYDTVQYLDPSEFKAFINRMSEILTNENLFIFDVVTETHVMTYWKNTMEKLENDQYRFWKKSWYDNKKKVQFTEIRVYEKSTKKYFFERHIQHIFYLDQIKNIILNSGLVLLGFFADFTLEQATENNDRVHFVLGKGGM